MNRHDMFPLGIGNNSSDFCFAIIGGALTINQVLIHEDLFHMATCIILNVTTYKNTCIVHRDHVPDLQSEIANLTAQAAIWSQTLLGCKTENSFPSVLEIVEIHGHDWLGLPSPTTARAPCRLGPGGFPIDTKRLVRISLYPCKIDPELGTTF